MNKPTLAAQTEVTGAGLTPAGAPLEVPDAAQAQDHRERLARLFRLGNGHADDRYLLDLVSRYRQVDPP